MSSIQYELWYYWQCNILYMSYYYQMYISCQNYQCNILYELLKRDVIFYTSSNYWCKSGYLEDVEPLGLHLPCLANAQDYISHYMTTLFWKFTNKVILITFQELQELGDIANTFPPTPELERITYYPNYPVGPRGEYGWPIDSHRRSSFHKMG